MSLTLYWGEDSFSLRKAEEALIEKIIDPQWRSFNLVLLYEATPESIAQTVLTPSFAPGSRVVVVRDYPGLSSKGEDEAPLMALLERGIPDETHLLFSGPSKIDGRTALAKALKEMGKFREFSRTKFPNFEEIADWVESEVTKRGGRVEREAAEAIALAVGADQGVATQEIEKLLTYSNTLTLSEVEALGCGGGGDVFMLAGAIANRDPARAVVLLRRLLLSSKGLVILAMLGTTIRNWLMVKLLSNTQKNPFAIAQSLGLKSDFRVKKDLEVCRRWKTDQLKAAVRLVLEADLALKQTSQSEQFVLEKLIIKLVCL